MVWAAMIFQTTWRDGGSLLVLPLSRTPIPNPSRTPTQETSNMTALDWQKVKEQDLGRKARDMRPPPPKPTLQPKHVTWIKTYAGGNPSLLMASNLIRSGNELTSPALVRAVKNAYVESHRDESRTQKKRRPARRRRKGGRR